VGAQSIVTASASIAVNLSPTFTPELNMNSKSFKTVLLGLAISATAISSMAAVTPVTLLGDAAPVAAADRTIAITPDTKYVNVVGGQTIKFNVNGQAFAWNFDGAPTVSSFDLSRVAPAGVLDHPVIAYVSVNPMYER
jgi:hypothetical protein